MSFGSEYETAPSWAPGGDRLAIESNYDVLIQHTDATGQPETMAGGSVVQMSPAWSRDRRSIVFVVFAAATQFDVWVQPIGDKSPARAFLATSFNEKSANLSPDGRHLIYVSDESGRDEVYVREFPSGQEKQQVSVTGGTLPKWSVRGDELFFVAGNTLMAASVQRTPAFSTGVPTALFTAAKVGASAIDYDVAADGKRFVVVRTLKAPERHAVVVESWLARVTGQAGRR
ncbi:MAG: PD40 domain-containing protein [Acidobacteria bacterium]|nr:PD40 domain-containing protein [Acidobacteriota bacterium]